MHHEINDHFHLLNRQLKQCRTGFYVFKNSKVATEISVTRNFAIKSAYDRQLRRAADEQLFGYESIGKGISMYFELNTDNDVPEELFEKIATALVGTKRIGRSRSAQYGLARISVEDFSTINSNNNNNNELVIYADSRLIFLDKYAQPTYTPMPSDFGLESGEIDWKKSQIRTFQYSPWNYKRASRETDRCGIEKGSVIVIKNPKVTDNLPYFVGYYRNEGFGRVIYNPAFLEVVPDTNGRAAWTIKGNQQINESRDSNHQSSDSPLIIYLKKQKLKLDAETEIYEKVNKFAKDYEYLFKGNAFAAQWGQIRRIAMKYKNKEDLESELFTKVENRNNAAYLSHGVAKEKWDERNRRKIFKQEFFDKISENNIQLALINLAAEMAKICRRKSQ